MDHEAGFTNISFRTPLALADLVDYADDRVVSRTLARHPGVGVTLFAFAAGEGLSTHTAPGDALVTLLDGDAVITIDGESATVETGRSIVMPADVPHAVHAETPCKLLLVVVKPRKDT